MFLFVKVASDILAVVLQCILMNSCEVQFNLNQRQMD